MFLTSTSDIIRVVTDAAVSTIGVHTDWVDLSGSTVTPGRTNTAITTATTTTVVASPAAATVRNVKGIAIDNNHATSSCAVTIQHFDGTTSIDIEKITLAAGESFRMAEDGEWRHLTVAGAEYEYAGRSIPNLGIAGTIAETYPREFCTEVNANPLTSGALRLQSIYLRAGQVVTSISFFSGTTGAGTPTNQFFALYGPRFELLAQSADDTTTAWAANTLKTLAMTAPFTVQVAGWYYVGIMVAATTVPTIKSGAGMTGGNLQIERSALPTNGGFTSGLTTVLPPTTTGPTGGSSTTPVWAAIT